MAVCTSAGDLPCSKLDGYDLSDGTASFYAACRPASEATEVEVSYRSWSAP